MKALVISEVFPPKVGGSGRWLYELYHRLPSESVLVIAGEHAHAAEFDNSHNMNVRRWPLTLSNWGIADLQALHWYWRLQNRLAKLIRQEHIDVIHCARTLPEGWLAWVLRMRLGIPYWVYVHGEELQYGVASRQLGWMMRRVFGASTGVIANSQNSAQLLRERWHVSPNKIHVLHPGVNTNYYVPAPADRAFRQSIGWHDRPVILTAGRLQARKGQDMLIRALPRIRESVSDVLYSIVGDGEERARLEKLVENLGLVANVQFLGEVDSGTLLRCYQQCDLFVLPNRAVNGDFEGFGMVLVEAQACGKAVVAGDSGGTSETMQVGETGEVVCCEGPEKLAVTVAELLFEAEQRMRMGRAARCWATSQFDWDSLALQASSLFGISPEPKRMRRSKTESNGSPTDRASVTVL